jgi:hypothetical protein
MGEINPSPEATTKTLEDLTAMEVDPDKGERLYKAALVSSSSGAAYRMLSKTLKTGKVDLVHYGCDLDQEGNPTTKWRIRRILEQAPERFERELEAIKKAIADDGEQVAGTWVHDMSGMGDVPAQGSSLGSWSKDIAAELKKKSA